MALISVSLVSPEGQVLPPVPGVIHPSLLLDPPTFEETISLTVVESFPCIGYGYNIAFHIWECGNVALADLRHKLSLCIKHSLIDTLFEMYYLQLPVATISDDEIERRLSPGLLRGSFSKSSSLDRSSYVDIAMESSKESSTIETAQEDVDWEQKEKLRRIQSSREALIRQASHGLLGQLNDNYVSVIPTYLSNWNESGSSVISYSSWDLPSNYCVGVTLSHVINRFTATINEMTFSLFKQTSVTGQYQYITLPLADTYNDTVSTSYVIIGRDLVQWKESSDPSDPTKHFDTTWLTSMLHLPLASWKSVNNDNKIPLLAAARKHSTFIPRHQFLMGVIKCLKVS